MSSTANRCAAFGDGTGVAVLDLDDWRVDLEFACDAAGLIDDVVFSPDGELLAVTPQHRVHPLEPTSLEVRNSHTGEIMHVLVDVDGWVRREIFRLGPGQSVVFSPDGTLLAACGRASIRIWGAETGQLVQEIDADEPSLLTFSPDGTMLAAACHGSSIKIWRRVLDSD